MADKSVWERLDATTERLRVYGGWLVRTRLYVVYSDCIANAHKSDAMCVAQTFVPDAKHYWEIK